MYLLASDYDGTLNQHGVVSGRDRESIARWRAAGNLFGIVSGRGYASIRLETARFDVSCDFLICNNGSAIYDGDGTLVESVAAEGNLLGGLVEEIIHADGWHAAITHEGGRFPVRLPNSRDAEAAAEGLPMCELHGVGAFNQLDTHFATDEEAQAFAARINRGMGRFVTAFANGVNVDIVPAGCGKTQGVTRCLARYGLPDSRALVIGDNSNDLDMIAHFHGFAVALGRQEVVRQAKKVYACVADLIEEYHPPRVL